MKQWKIRKRLADRIKRYEEAKSRAKHPQGLRKPGSMSGKRGKGA